MRDYVQVFTVTFLSSLQADSSFCTLLRCGRVCPDDHLYCCGCPDRIYNPEHLLTEDENGRLYFKCFPATSVVSLENGKLVTMSELQIGDKVKTGVDNTVNIHAHMCVCVCVCVCACVYVCVLCVCLCACLCVSVCE